MIYFVCSNGVISANRESRHPLSSKKPLFFLWPRACLCSVNFSWWDMFSRKTWLVQSGKFQLNGGLVQMIFGFQLGDFQVPAFSFQGCTCKILGLLIYSSTRFEIFWGDFWGGSSFHWGKKMHSHSILRSSSPPRQWCINCCFQCRTPCCPERACTCWQGACGSGFCRIKFPPQLG